MSGEAVHNHGTEDGPGLACPERRTEDGALSEMRARVNSATPGPWTTYRHAYGVGIETGDPDDGIQLFIETWGLTYPEREEDAEFIAHAREDMPRLLDALDAAEAEVERMRAAAAPVWDEDAVVEAAVVAARMVLLDAPEASADLIATHVLRAVREHLPTRPDREVLPETTTEWGVRWPWTTVVEPHAGEGSARWFAANMHTRDGVVVSRQVTEWKEAR